MQGFEKEFGPTKKCGIFISKMRPNFAASPDAIYNDALVEVKCPFVLKTTKPNDLSQLNPDQKRAHCRDVTLKLKKEHDYYGQVQMQMFCTVKNNIC